jgi:hypothetical protein
MMKNMLYRPCLLWERVGRKRRLHYYNSATTHYHHHQKHINVPIAGTQAFLMDYT